MRARAFLLSLTLVAYPAQAGVEECQSAIDSYNSAIGDISTYIKRYADCVSGSQAQDDCSSEFRRLKNAQFDLEMAVSSYGTECER